MVDQLRLFWNRPLRDSDRPRLFAIAATVVATAAGIFTLLDRTTPPPAPTTATRPIIPAATAVSTQPITLPAANAEAGAPSEEGQPSAALEASPADIAASQRAARVFLAGYLRYTYGHARARRITAASPALRHQLAAHPPRVPARERRRHPRVVTLQSDGVSHERAQLAALVADGQRRYTVALELTRTGRRWTVTSLGG